MKSYLVGISKHLCMKRVKPALKEKYVWLFLLSASWVVVVVVSKNEDGKLQSKRFLLLLFQPEKIETLKFFVRAIFNETKLCLSDHIGLLASAQQRQNKRTSTILAPRTMESVGAK